VAIALGSIHTCVIMDDGSVKCWGYNTYGQLGDGTTVPHSSPAAVVDLGGTAVTITADGQHTCVLLAFEMAQCWGRSGYGQLGDGFKTNRNSPVDVLMGGPAMAIAAGAMHTCGLMADGSAKCWGYPYQGQVGDGVNQGLTCCNYSPVLVLNW